MTRSDPRKARFDRLPASNPNEFDGRTWNDDFAGSKDLATFSDVLGEPH
jgi:hypothetical protein